MVGLIRLKEPMLIKTINHTNALVVIIITLRFQPKAYDSFRDLTEKAMSFNDVGIAFKKIN